MQGQRNYSIVNSVRRRYMYLLKSVERRKMNLLPMKRVEDAMIASEDGAIGRDESNRQSSLDEHIPQNSVQRGQYMQFACSELVLRRKEKIKVDRQFLTTY